MTIYAEDQLAELSTFRQSKHIIPMHDYALIWIVLTISAPIPHTGPRAQILLQPLANYEFALLVYPSLVLKLMVFLPPFLFELPPQPL